MHKNQNKKTQTHCYNNTFTEMISSNAGHDNDVLMQRDWNASSGNRQIIAHDLTHRRLLVQHRDAEALRRSHIRDDGRNCLVLNGIFLGIKLGEVFVRLLCVLCVLSTANHQ